MTSEHLPTTLRIEKDFNVGIGPYIARGADSEVYKSLDGKLVLKFYNIYSWMVNLEVAKKRLDFYRTITSRAAKLVKKEKWVVETSSKKIVPLEIVPINSVFINEAHNCVVAVSKFIDGTNLNAFNRSPHFDIPLYSALWGKKDSLSDELNKDLGTYGINLATCNIKIVGKKGNFKVVITDLCASVSSLRFKKNKA